MRTILLILPLLIPAAAPAPPAQPPATIRFAAGRAARAIPIEAAGDGLAFVKGQVLGTPVWLLLDTGSPSILSRRIADKLAPAGAESPTAGEEAQGSIRLLHDVTIGLPGADVRQPAVSSLDLDRLETLLGHKVDGILGAPLFEAAVVAIDVAGQTLSLFDPATGPDAFPGAAVPLTREGGMPYTHAKIVIGGRPPLEGVFLVNTGSDSGVLLYSPFVDRHRLLSGVKSGGEEDGSSGPRNFEAVLRADSITIGPYRVPRPVVSLSRATRGMLADGQHAGLIGASLLSRFRVTFDYARGRLILEKNARFTEPFRHDASGLSLAAQASDLASFEIRRVAPGSPAAQAGLVAGDVVLAVDGKPAKDIGLGGLRNLLREDGRTYTLSVFRAGEIRRVTLTCRRQL